MTTPDGYQEMVYTGVLHPDGTVTDERKLAKDDIRACPWLIMLPSHYREDGSCRCNDPVHTEMAEWGYVWSNSRLCWGVPHDSDGDDLC